MTNAEVVNSRDTGLFGDRLELAIRTAITPRTRIKGVAPKNRPDGTMYIDGKFHRYEVKSGCGELAKGEFESLNDIYPNADFILYCPDTWREKEEGADLLDITFCFTRAQFLHMLTSYSGRGKMIREKTSTNRYRVLSLQSFWSPTRPSSSKPIHRHILNHCQKSVRTWLEEIGRV